MRMPKNEAEVKFVLTLRYSKWNKDGYFWEIPYYPGNLEWIQQYFGERLGPIIRHEPITVGSLEHSRRIEKNQVLVIKTRSGWRELRNLNPLKNLDKAFFR